MFPNHHDQRKLTSEPKRQGMPPFSIMIGTHFPIPKCFHCFLRTAPITSKLHSHEPVNQCPLRFFLGEPTCWHVLAPSKQGPPPLTNKMSTDIPGIGPESSERKLRDKRTTVLSKKTQSCARAAHSSFGVGRKNALSSDFGKPPLVPRRSQFNLKRVPQEIDFDLPRRPVVSGRKQGGLLSKNVRNKSNRVLSRGVRTTTTHPSPLGILFDNNTLGQIDFKDIIPLYFRKSICLERRKGRTSQVLNKSKLCTSLKTLQRRCSPGGRLDDGCDELLAHGRHAADKTTKAIRSIRWGYLKLS